MIVYAIDSPLGRHTAHTRIIRVHIRTSPLAVILLWRGARLFRTASRTGLSFSTCMYLPNAPECSAKMLFKNITYCAS